jgi:hypothetical protein
MFSYSLSYAVQTLPISPSHLIARISTSNQPSIHLFQKLGFGITKTVEVFSEVELRWGWDPTTSTQNNDEKRHSIPLESRMTTFDS